MDHNLFKPKNFTDAQNQVVGDCNDFTMQQRWDVETPLFAKEIRSYIKTRNDEGFALVLDYGCGVGRLAKAVMSRNEKIIVKGIDASPDMMREADKYCGDPYTFQAWTTNQLAERDTKFDLAYCVYVLQHAPAIEIREILQRIYDNLKDDGVFIYCSSDYRMAIKFDGGGFFDDRFLGVNLQQEVERYFEKLNPLFSDQVLKDNPLLMKMIRGDASGLAHPAFVYRKKKLTGPLYNAIPVEPYPILSGTDTSNINPSSGTSVNIKKEYTKLVLINRLAPGDILVMTNAIRDLHKAFPGKYQTEVRSPCNAIFNNNPYFTKLNYDEAEYQKMERELHKGDRNGSTFVLSGDILFIDMHYPIIHTSGEAGWHFSYGHRAWLEEVLGIKIPQTSMCPEIYMSQDELNWISPVTLATNSESPYWVIDAGVKSDYTLKQYPRYQEVVDLLRDRIKFVQIGLSVHNHVPLNGVINMVGKTNDMRKLFKIIHGCAGVLTPVSFPMHIAASFRKPCVVVAGGREGPRWEMYPSHRYLYVNGCLPCATYDGCWKSKFEECVNKVGDVAKCMDMITPSDIARSIEMYYQGGVLKY